ncbi:hypothetical protein [Candidatus Binatus sp.]|uniref:hypothetical protein n=1 Tax=Candidatus Binatus sp. TaxID=2811406 RepID=UPI003C6F9186
MAALMWLQPGSSAPSSPATPTPLPGASVDASTTARAPLPFASIVRDRLLTAIAQGLEHKDWSAMYEVARQAAGLR